MGSIKKISFKPKDNSLINIRTANENDAKGIVELTKEILKEKIYMIHEIDEFKDSIKTRREQINRYNKAPGKLFLIAETGNDIAGYVSFNNWDTRKTMHTGFLSIYLRKKWRGKGIGRLLLQELINWAKKNKIIHKMSLAVFASNKNAIRLYLKMGFKIEGICPKDIKISGKYVDSVFMYIFV